LSPISSAFDQPLCLVECARGLFSKDIVEVGFDRVIVTRHALSRFGEEK
jgi:hypothetical protein